MGPDNPRLAVHPAWRRGLRGGMLRPRYGLRVPIRAATVVARDPTPYDHRAPHRAAKRVHAIVTGLTGDNEVLARRLFGLSYFGLVDDLYRLAGHADAEARFRRPGRPTSLDRQGGADG